MRDIKDKLVAVLPARFQSVIRPVYRWVRRAFGRGVDDSPPRLVIDSFGGLEVAYRKNTADEPVLGHSFKDDIFFSGVPEYQPGEGHTIVDIGAHIGTFSLLASSRVGTGGRVYAVEASEESFNLLRINVALNKLDNVSVYHLALSDTDGMCTLYHSTDGNWGHSTVSDESGSSEAVQACTLATFFAMNSISHCDFMKLNCEGAEFPILLSASRDLLRRVDTMLVLYHLDLWRHNTDVDLVDHLKLSGFECAIRNWSEQRGWIIASNTQPARDGL